MVARMGPILNRGEPLFACVELLYLAYAVTDALDGTSGDGPGEAETDAPPEAEHGMRDAAARLHAALATTLAAHPALRARLTANLAALSVDLDTGRHGETPEKTGGDGTGGDDPWEEFRPLIAALENGGLPARLDGPGLALLRREDHRATHFSSY
ncbi:MAG: hypothetical protein H0S85_14475 [Desulfovibrionaceae bacterium]|jgi:hypothetical protein|nr:hypothetical protein [Desulfovibrionaceae bacterium]